MIAISTRFAVNAVEPAAPLLATQGARVILGAPLGADGLPQPLMPSPVALFGPRGVCFAGPDGPLLIADTGHHRLLIWRTIPTADATPADLLIGQPGFYHEGRNAHQPIGGATLNMPTGLSYDGGIFALADAWNHRVLIWHGVPQHDNQPADVVLGQADFSAGQANRGRAQPSADSLNWCYGVTIADGRLLVADTGNRRVLIWNTIPTRNGQPADLVLGQADMVSRDDNAAGVAGAVGMRWPHAIAVRQGAIVVADAGNNRIMAWSALPNSDGAPCSFVLGQAGFDGLDRNRARDVAAARALNMPYGLAFQGERLLCADTASSRLLAYPADDLAMDRPALELAGQPNFAAQGDNRWRTAARDSLCWPFALAACGSLLAIADTGNNRVLLWELAP